MKVAQKNSTNPNTVSVALPHPLTHRKLNRPLRTASPMICPVLLQCPDEFIPNTKVARNRSTTPDTQPTRVSDVPDTSGIIVPPPDTLSDNHLEPVLQLRVNSRSVQLVSFNSRSPIRIPL